MAGSLSIGVWCKENSLPPLVIVAACSEREVEINTLFWKGAQEKPRHFDGREERGNEREEESLEAY